MENRVTMFVPLRGVMAGVLARTDVERGVWKAQASSDATLGCLCCLQLFGELRKRLRVCLELVAQRAVVTPEKSLYVASCYSSSEWKFKQPTAMVLPEVILKAGGLGCWSAGFLIWRVAG